MGRWVASLCHFLRLSANPERVGGPHEYRARRAGFSEEVTDSSQTSQFASADALGSIRLITDGSGNVVGTGSYSPWGVPDTGSVTQNGFGFAGEQIDPESGFVYLRNRYYDPTTSRFLTPDPLGALGSGVNLYAYVGNNPATLTDPSGLEGDGEALQSTAEVMAASLGIPINYTGDYVAYTNPEAGLATETEATAAAAEEEQAAVDCPFATEGEGKVENGNASSQGDSNGQRFYRGARGNAAPDFTPRPIEYKVTKAGTVRTSADITGRGVSVFDNPQSVRDKGFTPHEVNQSSVPDELTIVQRGNDPSHYEILPAPGTSITPAEYAEFLSRIVCY